MASPFDFDLGTYQGRIAIASGYVYELGHALPGQVVGLGAGDSNRVTQTADWTVAYRTSIAAAHAGAGWQLAMVNDVGDPTVLDLSGSLPDVVFGGVGQIGWELARVVGGEAELPSVQIAPIVADPAPRVIGNRVPCPGQVQVPVAAGIQFDLIGAVASPDVYVDGVLVATGSVGLGGWSYSDSSDPGWFRAVLAPPSDWDPQTTHAVRVDAVSAPTPVTLVSVSVASPPTTRLDCIAHPFHGGERVLFAGTAPAPADTGALYTVHVVDVDGVTLDDGSGAGDIVFTSAGTWTVAMVGGSSTIQSWTWSFTTVDITGPVIVAAQAVGEMQVKVTFSETLSQVGDWALSLVSGVPAVTPSVRAVTQVAPEVVLVALSEEMTSWATYSVSVTGAADRWGTARASSAQFQGWRSGDRDFDLYQMLLASDREQDESGDLRRFVLCYQDCVNLLLCKIDAFMDRVVDPDTADESWVDAMLADMGNPFAFDLDLHGKRRLLSVLVAIYKLKGTDLGIISVVRLFLGLDITIDQPWRGGWRVGTGHLGTTTRLASGVRRDLYSYRILSPIGLTVEQRAQVRAIAKYMQRAGAHLRAIVEPAPPPALPSHWALGLSRLGRETLVHA